MKTLLLLRHAKSSWSEADLSDHDRPLNDRGKRDAPRMGQLLRSQALIPDLIISSTAKRARKTAQKVVHGGQLLAHVELAEELYLAPPENYLNLLRRQDEAFETILMIGHNPGIEALSRVLTGQPEPFPTATLAQIELNVSHWCDVSLDAEATLRNLWRPRELDA